MGSGDGWARMGFFKATSDWHPLRGSTRLLPSSRWVAPESLNTASADAVFLPLTAPLHHHPHPHPQRDRDNAPSYPRTMNRKASSSDEVVSPISENGTEIQSKRPGFFARSGDRNSPRLAEPLPEMDLPELDVAEEGGVVHSESGTGSSFVFVESPDSKARALRALRREEAKRTQGMVSSQSQGPNPTNVGMETLAMDDPSGMSHSETTPYFPPPMNRVKGLPNPPIGPVMPEFEDLAASRPSSRSRGISASALPSSGESGGVESSGGVRRKPSVVKKLKDRVGKSVI